MIQRHLYTALYYLLTPVMFLRILHKHWQSHQYKEQRQSIRLAERLGMFPRPTFNVDNKPIWIHTVSVGEFLASMPLIKALMQKLPQKSFVITCTTTTGSAQITKTFAQEIASGRVFHVYLPYDLPAALRRFLTKIKPCLGIIMETEIWPNMLHIAHQRNIPMWLLNARMSAKSAKGYAHFKTLTEKALNQFSGIAAQDALDAGRLIELGAKQDIISITGSIKFDLTILPKDIEKGQAFRQQLQWQDKHVLIAASTHAGEEEILLDIFLKLKTQYPNLKMIVVPRHPERFNSVFQLLAKSGVNALKRSNLEDINNSVDILLGDSMGEMMSYFACADVVFMGGTMIPNGGHNILEPAALGLPIVYGPSIFNFYAINELFLQYQASKQATDKQELERLIKELLDDEQLAKDMGQRAQELIERNAGALDKMLNLIAPTLDIKNTNNI